MSAALELGVAGIGAFVQGAPDWPALRGVLGGTRALDDAAPARPSATLLPAAERRRAPDGVRLAVEVAQQACTMAGIDAAALPCVFASTHGELGITDYVCATLATAPNDLSPTRFHNSVLNAPAGYWTIATGCTVASSAVSAYHRTIAAALFEAAVFACSEDTPVLFASCDVAASGPLAEITRTRHLFGAALVLSPEPRHTRLRLAAAPVASPPLLPELPLALQAAARDNPTNAQALALLAALAQGRPSRLALPLSAGLGLDMEVTP